MVIKFFKSLGSGKNKSDLKGVSSTAKPKALELENNKKPFFYFSPFTLKKLIGRDSDINEIVQIKNQSRFLIIGDQQYKGIGKTAFSLHVARKFASQYPNGQVYIDLKPYGRKPLSIPEAITRVIWHFKIQCKIENSEEKLREVYLKTLSGKKIIFLLDGVTEPLEVLKLSLPKSCLMIVISQERINLPGFYRKSIKVLDRQSAQSLLSLHAPGINGKAKEIAELCEFNPMTLCVTSGLLATSESISEEILFEKMQQWAEGSLLMSLIDCSYQDMDEETAKVFRRMMVFPNTFDNEAQGFICQDKNNEHLTALVNRQLVMLNEDSECYQLHPVIQGFLRGKLTDFERSEAEKRHSTHFMVKLQGLQNALSEKNLSSTCSSVNAFDSDWENYQAAQKWAQDKLGTDDESNQLCASFSENGSQFLKWRLPPKTCLEWFDSGLSAAKHMKDNHAELRNMMNLSESTLDSKNYSRAKDLHEDSLDMALEIGDDSNAILLLDKLAFFQTVLNNNNGTIQYHEQALKIFKKNEDVEGQINILMKIAATHGKMDVTSDLIGTLKQALDLAEENGTVLEQRNVLSALGKAYFQSRDYRQSKEHHEKALVIDRKVRNGYGEACDLWEISLSLEKQGSLGEAIKKGESALNIFKVNKKKEAKLVQEKVKSWKNIVLSKSSAVVKPS